MCSGCLHCKAPTLLSTYMLSTTSMLCNVQWMPPVQGCNWWPLSGSMNIRQSATYRTLDPSLDPSLLICCSQTSPFVMLHSGRVGKLGNIMGYRDIILPFLNISVQSGCGPVSVAYLRKAKIGAKMCQDFFCVI